MEKRWVLREIPNETSISRLIQQLNISKTLATILAQRGVDTFLYPENALPVEPKDKSTTTWGRIKNAYLD